MFKRSILALLFMVVAVLSFAHADDAAPTTLEQAPPGVTIVGGQEPIPSATEQANVANTVEAAPAGVTLVGGQEPIPAENTEQEQFFGGRRRFFPGFRYRFRFPYGGGFRYGWRYPIGYWNTFGRGIYGPSCMFGRPFGGFYYC